MVIVLVAAAAIAGVMPRCKAPIPHSRYLLYSSFDGVVLLESGSGWAQNLAGLANALPHRGLAAEKASAAWRSDVGR